MNFETTMTLPKAAFAMRAGVLAFCLSMSAPLVAQDFDNFVETCTSIFDSVHDMRAALNSLGFAEFSDADLEAVADHFATGFFHLGLLEGTDAEWFNEWTGLRANYARALAREPSDFVNSILFSAADGQVLLLAKHSRLPGIRTSTECEIVSFAPWPQGSRSHLSANAMFQSTEFGNGMESYGAFDFGEVETTHLDIYLFRPESMNEQFDWLGSDVWIAIQASIHRRL